MAIRDAANAANNEYFVYRNGTEPVAWTRGTGATAVHQYYVYGTQPHVPDLIYVDNDADTAIDLVYRVLTDERGSVRMVLRVDTATPSVVQRIDYDPWGAPTFVTGGENVQPFGYAGSIWLNHARFWHMGARDYDPAIGRWTSKDPIRFSGGMNLYEYAGGDPVNYIDVDGHLVWFIVGIALAWVAYDVMASRDAGEVGAPRAKRGIGPFALLTPEMAPWHRDRNENQICPGRAPHDDPQFTRDDRGAHDAATFRGNGFCAGFQCSYDESGSLSSEPLRQGSYGYSPPGTSMGGHFGADVLPAFMFGTGGHGPTRDTSHP